MLHQHKSTSKHRNHRAKLLQHRPAYKSGLCTVSAVWLQRDIYVINLTTREQICPRAKQFSDTLPPRPYPPSSTIPTPEHHKPTSCNSTITNTNNLIHKVCSHPEFTVSPLTKSQKKKVSTFTVS